MNAKCCDCRRRADRPFVDNCPKLEATAHGIFSKPNSTYKGADEVSYEVKSASGKVENHTVRIMVKEATPAGAKPNTDADTEL